ncbi:MAG TPA: uracil-DNA glycosylase [Acholeplasmataceae bacterium]|nr:uracil-DNA glycosylase [Acholeplasmataceae bacterium]
MSNWDELFENESKKEYFKKLDEFILNEYKSYKIFPPYDDIYNAFNTTPLDNVKVVIIGQDPYHNEGQSHGLCFSVMPNTKIPPSLRNIYKELQTDLGCSIPNNGYLEKWAKQGVLLLNTVLTVREKEPNSHKKKGWENFTDSAIKLINNQDRPIVFILWGRQARDKRSFLTNDKHLIIESAHPSPLSSFQGFFGSRPFSKTNDFLMNHGIRPIEWQIDDI